MYTLGWTRLAAEAATGCATRKVWGLSDLPGGSGWPDARSLTAGRPADVASGAPAFGRWIVADADTERSVLRIATDPLGSVWLYIATVPEGYIISGDFGALAAELGPDLEVDHSTALLELVYGYSPDRRTVFRQIEILPAGAVLQVSGRETKAAVWRTATYGRAYAAASESEKYRALDDAFDAVIGALQKSVPEDLLLSISGGFDSRYILGCLDRAGRMPELLTFGDPQSDEVLDAKAACARIGTETRVFPIPHGDWEQWRRAIQSLGNTATVQWAGWSESWLERLQRAGSAVAIGYLGDALSGKHLGEDERADQDWVSFWLEWSARDWPADSLLLPSTSQKRLADVARERFEQCVANVECAYPFQRALHLDLHGRQRRWVASQPNLIGRHLAPVLFFFHDALFKFWTNVALTDLRRQRLYLAYAHHRFPELFPAREEPAVWSRIWRKAGGIAGRLAGSAAQRRRPPVIDRDRVIVPNLPRIRALIDEVSDDLAPMLDVEVLRKAVERYGAGGAVTSGQLIRTTNLMHLLSLRRRR